MTWLEVKGRNCNSIVSVILLIIRLPYSVQFTGWVWFGIVVFNWQIVPWFVLTPVFFWSFICSRAATESAEIIKSDVRENGGVVETRHEIQMILWNLIQYPTFLTATWVLFGSSWLSLSTSRLNIHKETASFYFFNIPATVSAASVNRHPLFKKDRRHAFLF